MGIRRVTAIAVVVLSGLSLTACGSGSTSTTDPADTTVPAGSPIDIDTAEKNMADALARCNPATQVSGRPIRIATTVAPITSIVGTVVGDTGGVVTGIIPEGTNSHTYEPPTSAAATLENADVIFTNGLMLEDPTLELAKKTAPKAVICEIGSAIVSGTDWIFDFSFPAAGGKPNPHIWTSPPYALQMITLVRDVLSKMDPTHQAAYDDNYVKASGAFMALDEAMKKATETVDEGRRKLLTYHDSFAYFAEHFGYTVVGAIQPSSFEEPSTKDIADLIKQVEAQGVKAIFGSEVFPSPVLEQIGKETGVRYVDTLRDDDLPGKPGEADHSLLGLLKADFATIVKALGGKSGAVDSVKVAFGVPDKAVYPQ